MLHKNAKAEKFPVQNFAAFMENTLKIVTAAFSLRENECGKKSVKYGGL